MTVAAQVTIALIVAFGSVLVMLLGIFWTLYRIRRLERGSSSGRHARRWSIGGHAEFSIPEWLLAMRSGNWSGPALPLLVAFLGMLGVLYGIGAVIIVFARDDSAPFVPIGLVVAMWLYATFNMARAFVRANAQASRILAAMNEEPDGDRR